MNQTMMADHDTYVLLKELKMLRSEIAILKDREEEVKSMLSVRCDEREADAICNSEGTILATYKSFNQKRFDTKTFKECCQDIYEKYVITTVVKSLLLK